MRDVIIFVCELRLEALDLVFLALADMCCFRACGGGTRDLQRSARARSRKSTHHTHFHHVALDHATRAVAAGAEARTQERLRSVAKRYPAAAPLGALPSASETVRLLRYGL